MNLSQDDLFDKWQDDLVISELNPELDPLAEELDELIKLEVRKEINNEILKDLREKC